MAPEVTRAYVNQQRFHGEFKKADVFSAGVVVYELLRGIRPFTMGELAAEEESRLPEAITDEDELMQIIRLMVMWDPDERCEAQHAMEDLDPEVPND
jgi:serine/threonine protein kinase